MILRLIQHVLSASYLYALRPYGSGADLRAALPWAAALAVLTAWAMLWHERRRRAQTGDAAWSRLMRALVALAWLALAAQWVTEGPWSARIWVLSLIALAVACPALVRLSESERLRTLLLCPPAKASGQPRGGVVRRHRTIWLLLHALALSALLLSGRIGPAVPALALACLFLAGHPAGEPPSNRTFWPEGLRVEVLLPLLVPYTATLLQSLVQHVLGVDTGPYQAFGYPDLWSPWFHPLVPWLTGAGWMLGITLSRILRQRRGPTLRMALTVTATTAAAGMFLWMGLVYGRHLSHGAGASDPYAYLQMAADLAISGDPRHAFALTAVAETAGVPLWPLVPVGYHPPLGGVAATVWPPGWPALLAPLVWLGGERLALWGAPLWLLLAAWLTWHLGRLIWQHEGVRESSLYAALAAGILLTSYEALSRTLVPMADAAAAALTVGALLALLHARRRDELRWSALAGLALALAYDVRHPQLPLALAALPALLAGPRPWRRKAAHLGVFMLAALLSAAPDLWYHTRAFGAPWHTESAEWFLLSPGNIPATLHAVARHDLWRRNEFGYLWPLIVLGLGHALARRSERQDAFILFSGAAGVTLFHLSYEALRLRDLIPLFPLLALAAARGVLALTHWARGGPRPVTRRAVVVFALLFSLAARSAGTLGLPWQQGVETFGHLTAGQRQSYTALGAALPADAVVGTALSAGAVRRYAKRDTVRPAQWDTEELDRFIQALDVRGMTLYLLADGEEMEAWLPTASGRYALQPVGTWDVPLYGRGGQPVSGMATLWRVSP